jgi:hypothetical protein
MLYDFLCHSYLSEEDRKSESVFVIEAIASFLQRIPQDKYNIYFDEAASTLIRKAAPFIKTISEKVRLLGDILVKNQPNNYIHAKIVEKLSLSILDY